MIEYLACKVYHHPQDKTACHCRETMGVYHILCDRSLGNVLAHAARHIHTNTPLSRAVYKLYLTRESPGTTAPTRQ